MSIEDKIQYLKELNPNFWYNDYTNSPGILMLFSSGVRANISLTEEHIDDVLRQIRAMYINDTNRIDKLLGEDKK